MSKHEAQEGNHQGTKVESKVRGERGVVSLFSLNSGRHAKALTSPHLLSKLPADLLLLPKNPLHFIDTSV